MKMNDSLGMSKAADVDILLPSDRNLPPGKITQLRRGRKEKQDTLHERNTVVARPVDVADVLLPVEAHQPRVGDPDSRDS